MTTAPATATATLTRILLNRNTPAVRRDLADSTELHKTVMRLLPDHLGDQPRQQGGLLFRLEPHTRRPALLVQTLHQPRLDQLPANYGTAQTRDLTRMFHTLTPGSRVRYRITANPSRRDPKRRNVIPLHGDAALSWWHRRATQAGLDIHHVEAERRRFQAHTWQAGHPYHALTQFDGTATITDPAALTRALLTGIGKGKAYGAGLLSLAPAPTA